MVEPQHHTSDTTDKSKMPFIVFENGLELFGRMMESGCKLSIQFVEAMDKAVHDAVKEQDDTPPPVIETLYSPSMIPSTGDLEVSSNAVETAMNAAALRQLESVAEKPAKTMRETIADAKAGISAAKGRSG